MKSSTPSPPDTSTAALWTKSAQPPTRLGSAAEPLGVGIAMASIGKARLGSTATVLGVGPIGLNCLAVLKASGARRILCFDKRPNRLALAKSWGALETTDSPEQLKKLSKQHHPDGADVVIDATGHLDLIPQGIKLTRFGGSFILAAFYKHSVLPFEPDSIQGPNIRMIGAGNNAGFIEPAVLAVGDGVLSTQGMITHRFRLEDYERAFSDAQAAAPDYIKGVFVSAA